MARVHPFQSNFTAGELSPRLEAQIDFKKYSNGCSELTNMLVYPHGGARRRPGTHFAAEAKTSQSSDIVRLIPFEFNVTQSYILEFTHEFIRFYKDNGQIVEAEKSITAITKANPGVVTVNEHGYSNGDDVWINSVAGMTEVNSKRFTIANKTDHSFELSGVNTTDFTNYTSGGITEKVYEISSPFTGSQLFDLHFAQSADIMYICHSAHHVQKLSRTAHTTWTLAAPTFTWDVIDSVNFIEGETYTITTLGDTSWDEQDAFEYTLDAEVGSVFTASVVGSGTGKANVSPWYTSNGFPRAVSFYEQRLFLAGTSTYPQTLWGSKTADYENFTQGTGLADESLEYVIATNRVNVIRWLQPSRDLILGTAGGEFKVGRPTGQPLTPSNVMVTQQTTYGSWTIPPIQIGSAILFVQRARRKLREFSYMYQTDGYIAQDMTLLAEHITSGYLQDMDYQQEPDSIVWACSADGKLLSMTYERPEDVVAWARHDVDGLVQSVAVITNITQDQLWILVRRTIGGITKNYVEYLDPDLNVDSGLTGTVTYALSTVSGLDHLEGETVSVVIDGAVFPNEIVSGGEITPSVPSTWTTAVTIEVGLPYVSVLKTMRVEAGSQAGTAQGRKKRWNEVMVRLLDTTGVIINGDQVPFRTSADLMGSGLGLFTGDKRVTNLGWDRDGIIEIKQEQSLPMTVLGIHGTLTTSD